MKNGVTREELAAIAAKASCDPRTALAYLHGLSVRQLVRERIEDALGRLGMKDRIRKAG